MVSLHGKNPIVETHRGVTVAHLGKLSELGDYEVESEASALRMRGKVWLKSFLKLGGMEVSFGLLPEGAGPSFLHSHKQNEELYLFLSGEGQMLIDGKIIEVSEGSAVRVSPEVVRCWRNTGTANMVYIVIQAKEGSLEQWTGTDGIVSPDKPDWSDRSK